MRIPEADRRIIALAVPALGALAAEPLYVLVDTGIVGHLGVAPLAALAIASLLAGWGIVGVWLAIVALIAARFVFNGARFLGEGWVV